MTTREPYIFKNWKEMYDTIKAGADLYCAELSSYAFLYNEDGAICTYHIDLQRVEKLAIDSKNSGEPGYWGQLLGPGGIIHDDDSFDRKTQYETYIKPSFDFCKKYYKYKWYKTTDIIV